MAHFEYQGLKDKEATLAKFEEDIPEHPEWARHKQPPDAEAPLDKASLRKAINAWRKEKLKDAAASVESLDAAYRFRGVDFKKGVPTEVDLASKPKSFREGLKALCASGVLKEAHPAKKFKPAPKAKPKAAEASEE